MPVRPKKAVPQQDGRTYTLTEYVVRGMNELDLNARAQKLPLMGRVAGRLLRKVGEKISVAEDFTAKTFIDFYQSIESDLEQYGSLIVSERLLRTPAGEITTSSGCNESYRRNDAVKCNSYFKFESGDKTLAGMLSIGYPEDRAVTERLGRKADLNEERLKWVIEKLRQQGIQGAGDLVASKLLAVVWGPLAFVGLGDLARRAYNMSQFDAHWTLELNPKGNVTKQQFDAYRMLIEKYK